MTARRTTASHRIERVLVTTATTLAVGLLGVSAALPASVLPPGERSMVDGSVGVGTVWFAAAVIVAVASTLYFVRGVARLLPALSFVASFTWFLGVLT